MVQKDISCESEYKQALQTVYEIQIEVKKLREILNNLSKLVLEEYEHKT